MSNRMDIISKEELCISKSEDILIDKIQKSKFFELLNNYDFTYDKLQVIFESEIYTNQTQNNLNIAIRKLKKQHDISISDSVLFLEEFTPIKKILYFFDGETKWALKQEMAEKYNIELETNELFKILS